MKKIPSLIHPKQFQIKKQLFTIWTNHSITDKEAEGFVQWTFDTHFSKYVNPKSVTVSVPKFRDRGCLELMVTATKDNEEKRKDDTIN